MKSAPFFLTVWLLAAGVIFAAPSARNRILSITEITSGLSNSTTTAFIGAQDILVLQKGDGRVRRVISGVLQPGFVLDVAVNSPSERGLLGIALHPKFSQQPLCISLLPRRTAAAKSPSLSPLRGTLSQFE